MGGGGGATLCTIVGWGCFGDAQYHLGETSWSTYCSDYNLLY